jgi:nitrate reductase gamma subunit
MNICTLLGILSVLLYPAAIFVIAIVRDFDNTSTPPKENYTYWEFSLNASKRDIPMIIFGYLFGCGLLALAIYLTFFSCAFDQ